MTRIRLILLVAGGLWLGGSSVPPVWAQLNESCTVSALNRTAPVDAEGVWVLPNVPAGQGPVRVRATCVESGLTRSGASDFFEVPANDVITVEEIRFDGAAPVPASLTLSAPLTVLTAVGLTVQLQATAVYPSGATADVTGAGGGTDYRASNSAIATVDAGGLVTARASGSVLVSAVYDGALGVLALRVVASADSDGDGLPDDFEIANGLDPNNPADALDDPDEDGLTTAAEFQAGLDPANPDTDGDGLLDGEEVSRFGTNPLLFDTDGDGLSDGLEVTTGSDPLDSTSFNLAEALAELRVTPATFSLVFNTLLGEASTRLTVTGLLIDGNALDLTSTARGTNYVSSDFTRCSFGAEPGRIFAGADGPCTITVTNSGFAATSEGSIRTFSPTALAAVVIPGEATSVDVSGDFAYVASGTTGLHVVDVSDRRSPFIAAVADTPGFAKDVRVVGDLAYVADGASGLQLFDVANPFAPRIVGSLATLGDVEDLAIEGELALLAEGGSGLRLVDVSDPVAPRVVSTIPLDGGAWGVGKEPGSNLAVVASRLSGIHVVDLTQAANPVRLGSVSTDGNARDVAVRGDFAFVADGQRSFTVIDFRTPTSPFVVASTPPELGGLLVDVAVARDLAFGADFFFVNGVPIISVASPGQPLPRAILDFRAIGEDDGSSVAADQTHVYLTSTPKFVGGVLESRLYIGQYLQVDDTAGQAPQVSITAPRAGDELTAGSTIECRVEATDDVAVSAVEFVVDDQVVFTDLSSPYTFELRVPLAEGTLRLDARAIDFGGNVASAGEITLRVVGDNQPPRIVHLEPTAGAEFTSGEPVVVSAEVEDNLAVQEVVFRLAEQSSSDLSAPYGATFVAPPVEQATAAVIEVEALDVSGFRASAEVPVQILPSADQIPPTVQLVAPGDGDGVLPGRSVPITFSIADDSLVHAYSVQVNGETIASATLLAQASVERSLTWVPPAGAIPGDTFLLRVEARDFGLNTVAREVRLVVPAGVFLEGSQTLDGSLAGQALVLGAGTFTVAEPLHLASLMLLDGARVHGPASGLLQLEVDGAAHVGAGASLDVTAQGFSGGGPGHLAGFAPDFVTGSQPDAGGTHGGSGIVGRNAGPAGAIYDSVYLPSLGGGGGSTHTDIVRPGGAGGGVIDLEVGQLTLNGQLLARGETRPQDGFGAGGAGGSVLVRGASLRGSGAIDASGGDSFQCCNGSRIGSGGGGRVALHVGDLTGFDAGAQVRAVGGTRRVTQDPVPDLHAGPGTILLLTAASTYGTLILDQGETAGGADRSGPSTELPSLGSGEILAFEVSGPEATVRAAVPFHPQWLGAWMALFGADGEALGTFQVRALDGDGAVLAGAAAAVGAFTYRGEYRFDRVELRNGAGLFAADPLVVEGEMIVEGTSLTSGEITARDLTVRPGAVMRPARGSLLQLRVPGRMAVETGGALDVTAMGFAGGRAGHLAGFAPELVAGSLPDAGGSHGGLGIVGRNAGPAGAVFDSVYLPSLGGGGGSTHTDIVRPGGAGGGVIDLEVGELVLDGAILAHGETRPEDGFGAGGGGGTVLIRATTLRGAGSIDASGGDSLQCCNGNRIGSGGGGRVALYVEDLTGFDPATQVKAIGGTRRVTQDPVPDLYAGPGTILLFTTGSTYGTLVLDRGENDVGTDRTGPSTELPALGAGDIASLEVSGTQATVHASAPFQSQWLGAWMALEGVGGEPLGTFQVVALDAAGGAVLVDAGGASGAVRYRGEYRFDRVELRNGAGLFGSDPIVVMEEMVVEGASATSGDIRASDLTVRSGAVMSPAQGSILRLEVPGRLTVELGGALDVTGLGFPGGSAPQRIGGAPGFVAGSLADAGGSHGGRGRLGRELGPAGEVYGSAYTPTLGGGGGSTHQDRTGPGGAGGGLLELDVGELVLDGELRARGETLPLDRFGAGGAGGSILIRGAALRGSGLIDASGGDSVKCCASLRLGSGGGGRVALYVGDLSGFDPATQVNAAGGASRLTGDPAATRYASPGTVFVRASSATHGDLRVHQGSFDGASAQSTTLPSIGTGLVGVAEAEPGGAGIWIESQEPAARFSLGVIGMWVRVSGADYQVVGQTADRRRLLLAEAAGAVSVGDSYQGLYKFDAVRVSGGAVVEFLDQVEADSFVVEPGSSIIQP